VYVAAVGRCHPVVSISLYRNLQTSNIFLETFHFPSPGSAAHRPGPGTRLRDIAAALSITEGSAYGIVTDLTAAGYVVRQKDSRSSIWSSGHDIRHDEAADWREGRDGTLAELPLSQAIFGCLRRN
jgi:hypothetical protein